MVQQSAASMKRISIIMDTEPEVRDSDDSAVIKELLGNIEFKNISFRYDDVLPEVLHNINLKVPTGSTLAIIGNTGSGKTTLVNLVSRLFDTSSGSVEIDGYDVKNIPVDVLRSNIGYVTQETFLFSTSIKENILFGVDGYNEAEFKEACDIAQIDKDVQSFQNKYDTVIGERGITLSGGQKQRVSIARAVLKKPAILILDDALSAVDTYTEEEILRRLTKFMQSRTSIIISHRISTVKNADLIIALEDGKIAESGNHDELLKAEGIYFDLYTKQLLERELDELE
jgi:ATP-binding cassette subfamily B protein